MANLVLEIQRRIGRNVFTDTELKELIGGSPASRYGKIKRALSSGEIVHVKRGLYCLPEHLRRTPLNLFSVAQFVYGPSYVSLESALSFHGWIPEAVYGTASVSQKRSREFKTNLGFFMFRRVACNPFFVGVERHLEGQQGYLVASPWKAIADYVYVYKKEWKGLSALTDSLRIEPEFLASVDREHLASIISAYRNRPVQCFLRSVVREIGR